jgi:hypothetical protein
LLLFLLSGKYKLGFSLFIWILIMTTKIAKQFISLILSLALALTLTACGGDTVELELTGPTGPNTDELLETLPKGLKGDKENASHSSPIKSKDPK